MSLGLSEDGTALIVGADYEGSTRLGAAYFYNKDAVTGVWTLNTTTNGIPSANASFYGNGVAMAGNGTAAAVGAPQLSYMNGATKVRTPTVFMYTYNAVSGTWSSSTQIVDPGGNNLSGFGNNNAVSLSSAGTTLAVGAQSVSSITGTSVAGVTYVYVKSGSSWGSPAVLTKPATANRRLGSAVSLSPDGTKVVTGQSSGNASSAAGGGAAFLWSKSPSTNTWSLGQTVSASDTVTNDAFGFSVSLAAGVGQPVVGAVGATVSGLTNAGATYIATVT